MADHVELKGIARFSPRLQLLRRLAGSDDVVQSSIARMLIEDPTARRTGGWMEFLMVFAFPALALLGAVMTAVNASGSGATATFIVYSSSGVLQRQLIRGSEHLFLWVLGLLLSVLPGLALIRKAPGADSLGYLTHGPREVHSRLYGIQLVSYVMPFVLGWLLLFVINRSVSILLPIIASAGLPPSDYLSYLYPMVLLDLLTGLSAGLLRLAFADAALYTSFTFRKFLPSLAVLAILQAALNLLVCFLKGTSFPLPLSPPQPLAGLHPLLLAAFGLALSLASAIVFHRFAYAAIHKQVMQQH